MLSPGNPIPYESLRTYFQSDPASSWGAFVAGCLLVLAHEKGARYNEGISILVASDVPEGKLGGYSKGRPQFETCVGSLVPSGMHVHLHVDAHVYCQVQRGHQHTHGINRARG
jgi:hypothetical protein